MSRTRFSCRHCGQPLGYYHHSGRLHPNANVTVFIDLRSRLGSFVRLVCPRCGIHRDYHDGSVVVPSRQEPPDKRQQSER